MSGNRRHAGGLASAMSNFHRIQAEAELAKGDAPKLSILNVLRVALDRADMNHRATGFMTCEVDAAKAWVAAALSKAAPKREESK